NLMIYLAHLSLSYLLLRERQYLVLVPSQLYAGVPEKVCVLLNHLNETVALTVTLEYETEGRNLLTDLEILQLISVLQIPDSFPFAFITVQVQGPTQNFIKKKPIYITKAESLVFVQTDKPIYKPGQTVQFRIFSVDVNFHPLNETVSLINPKRNRIFQWPSFKLQGGLSQLSFPLSVEPALGPYKVVLLKEPGKRIEHSFEVDEYVLPKFEVQVKMPKKISFLEDEFEVSVCSLYTYGKPVRGLVTINVCRKYLQYSSSCNGKYPKSICEEFSQQVYGNYSPQDTNTRSCFLFNFSELFFRVGINGHGSSEITNTLSKLKFTKCIHITDGLPFFGQVLLVNEKDQPIPNETVVVNVDMFQYSARFTTNEHGLVNFSIDTSNFTSSFISVGVIYKQNSHCFDSRWLEESHIPATHTASHIFSPSKSYIQLEPVADTVICGQTQEIRVHYILNGQILTDERELTFYYLVRLKATVALPNYINPKRLLFSLKGVFSLSFRVESDIAPIAQLLVYTILPNGEVIADTEELDIENCFANKVNLSFSSAQGLPASNTSLKITAAPYSLCGLRAVDKSVLLMKPEAEFSPQSVYNLLSVKRIFSMGYRGPMNEDGEKCINAEDITHNGIIYIPKQFISDDDAYKKKKIRNLSRSTKLYIEFSIYHTGFLKCHALESAVVHAFKKRNSFTLVFFFPLSSMWGKHELAIKVPDTITEWKASALCLSGRAGLGLSPTISLTAFQPFFLELTLPYSVVRGEAFTLKATVFNYLSHCIRVSIQLEASSAFLAIPVEKNEESQCVCGNKQRTMSWAVTPKSLGEVNFTATAEALRSQELCGNKVPHFPEIGQKDTVIKPLLVENISLIFPSLMCICLVSLETGGSEKLSLKLPSNVVEGSARATYSVLGDILGSAMQNLQNLLRMPYGCGEQNMVLFTPNIYVLNYLNETGQLTEKIKSKAISYLISGYQRQLNYKHSDGSYSTFGDRDGRSQGNTWLTAFVLKSFSQAQSHIFVEDSHITDSLTWLSRKQKENGCFQRSGSLLNNAIKGGVDDEVTLSAYITIALLEMPLLHSIVRNALFCLERAWQSASEAQGSFVYTKALLAYAFALAGDQAKRNKLLESLHKEAVKEEDSIHWQRPRKPQEVNELYSPHRAPSVDVEMTSYCLLAHLTAQPAPSSEDLSVATQIVKWLTKQQNPNGGFSSTQDTVVALQALSKYGAATFIKGEKAATVTVKSAGTFSEEFQVDEAKRLLLQEVALPEIPGKYSTAVTGSGCVYIQTSLRYNILPKKEGKAPFTLKVETLPKNCDGVSTHRKVQIHVNISYTGERPSSNMVIVDVKMVSGFIPVKSSVRKVKRETKLIFDSNSVFLSLQLTHHILSFFFSVEQDIAVKNLKPATIKAYDYYETEEFTIEEYSVPCSAGKV
uniref:Alpha-2-macroglobulin n=1 Tax=Bos mutus grunniens TaxID=30521 RepID=A0A8B9XV49_BOSMU